MEEEAEMMMMSEEDSFRAMVEEGVDRSFDEKLPIFRSEMTRKLGEMMELEMESPTDRRLCAFTQLDWAEGLEDSTVNVIKYMAGDRDCCRRGAAHFAAKEPALAETLRSKAAWCDATCAELEEIAAGARRLRSMCLRILAEEATEEDIVCVAAAEYLLADAATCTSHDGSSIPVFLYEAVADQVDAAVAAGASDPGVKRLVEGFAERARSLRRRAAELGGEDAVKLRDRAATVEALCTDTESFLQKMVSSFYWKTWMCLIGREAALGAETPMDEDDTTPLLSTLERSDQREL